MAGDYPVAALFTDLANRSTKIAEDTQVATPGRAQGSPYKLLDWLLLRGDRKRTTASAIVWMWAAFKDRIHRVHPPSHTWDRTVATNWKTFLSSAVS